MFTRNTFSLLALSICLGGAGRSLADDPPAAEQPQIDPAAIEQLWTAFATPGPAHEEFKELVGRWDCEVRTYMPDPANPQVSRGEARFELLLGGRFLRQEFECDMAGQKFHGMGISGYDNALEKYVGVWIDDMGTGIMHTSGTYDEASDTITETGEGSSPIGAINYRLVTKSASEESFVFTMFMTMPGAGEQKTMEITYTRGEE